MFSRAHDEALAQSAEFHLTHKTFSGSMAPPHAATIGAIIARTGAASVLDYGCGKGLQYQGAGSLEKLWGVPVTKYDPAWAEFSAEPQGRFDLVIATHVLCWIPVSDMAATVERLFGFAGKAVYVGEMIGPTKKSFMAHPERFPRDWTRREWSSALRAMAAPVPMYLGTFEVIDPERRITVAKVKGTAE